MGLMDGKAGLVTAGGDGIGKASAIAFAAEGASLIVSDIDESRAEETARLIVNAGGIASAMRADVVKEDDMTALVRLTVEKYGRLDFAHNNAGFSSKPAPVTAQVREDWEHVLNITLTGTMLGLKHEILQMQSQGGGGAIVCTVSGAGLIGIPNKSAYCAAKWGVAGLIRSAALENARRGIRINGIAPGITATEMVRTWAEQSPGQYEAQLAAIPMRRLATPEDQANGAVWLCSDRAAYITGIVLPVDGGVLAGQVEVTGD